MALVLLLMVSCGGGDSAKPAAKKTVAKTAGKAAAPAAAPAKAKETQPSAEAAAPVVNETTYRYDARGRRDPFRSVLDTVKSKERLADLPPLQRVEIIDLKLTAIVWGSMGASAMIKTPDGKGYTVKAGTLVGPNKGVIESISKTGVMIREDAVDIFGVKKSRKIELTLHPQEEGKE